MAGWLDRFERASWRIYRLDAERMRREEPLRAELLRQVLIAAAAASLVYLLLNLSGVMRSRTFFDVVELPVTVALCAWLLRRGNVSVATTLLVVVMSHPASFIVSEYGVGSGAGAVFLPTILVCGLLIGGYFLATWTIICCLLIFWIALRELSAGRFANAGDMFRVLIFWWAIFAATCWLVHLFSRHLEDLLAMARTGEQKQRSAIIEERTRIAREIHDTLAQGFTGIVVQLNAAEEIMQRDIDRSRQHLERARQLARTSLDEARRSVLALRPESLEAGFASALERIAGQLMAGTGIRLDIETRGQPPSLSIEAEANLLRICQEAITNAVRHAKPGRIKIRLSHQRDSVRADIEDDGIGIEESKPGLGMTGMRERAERLGGRLEIKSSPGKGTSVIVVIPDRVQERANV